MTFSELMGSIRLSYVEVLAASLESYAEFRREAVLRGADGTPALDRDGGTPVRVDAIGADGVSLQVDATRHFRFDEFSFDLNGTAVSVAPFTWDWLGLEISGEVPGAGQICERWFMRWFDGNDVRTPGSDGLRGVAHFLGEIQPIDNGIAVRVDMGSCPEEALDDLLFSLAEAGAVNVRLGA